MKKFQESKFRTWLAKQPATKLFIKAFIDLAKLDFFQFKTSLQSAYHIVLCHLDRMIKNKEIVVCNFCDWKGNRFYPHATSAGIRLEEKCPICHSIPRYRTLMKFLIEDIDLFNQHYNILEIGPNRSLQDLLLDHPNFEYLSVDLKAPHAMEHMDVTDLKLGDELYDFLLCIGVMHYVENDLKGFQEMYRVLKPGGKLIFASGINEASETTETFEKRTPANNFTVRLYGWDVKKMMEETGFKVTIYDVYKKASKEERKRFGLGVHSIFLLEKAL